MFGFRECTEEDQAQLAEWLAVELCGVELSRDRLAGAVVARCRKDRLEPADAGAYRPPGGVGGQQSRDRSRRRCPFALSPCGRAARPEQKAWSERVK